ncbi:MAG: heavy metal-binding domain-containing protein [Simkaniaceae bacterium]|nr:heavy metal-binding domain-containing protein [Simkaniaceae bacterium]
MIIATSDHIAGYTITAHLGTVIGNTIRAKHIGKDIMAGLRTIVGGEVKEYTSMLAEAREQALQRMINKAEEYGADGVVAVRFQTSMVMTGSAELLVYGTAVKLQKN